MKGNVSTPFEQKFNDALRAGPNTFRFRLLATLGGRIAKVSVRSNYKIAAGFAWPLVKISKKLRVSLVVEKEEVVDDFVCDRFWTEQRRLRSQEFDLL